MAERNDFDEHDDALRRETEDLVLHEAATNAWFATSLEITKSIFTISSAGFGIAVNMLYTGPSPGHALAKVWVLLGAFMFAASAFICVTVFSNNKKMIQGLRSDDECQMARLNQIARARNIWSQATFVGGLVFFFIAGACTIWL